jgi:hypothetical protein
MRVSLDDVDPSGGHWAIRATCTGGRFEVEFRPGEKLSVPDLGHASSEEIAVECGKPERVAVSDEELRRRTETMSGADLAQPTFEPTRLSCVADGSLVVEAHPGNRGSESPRARGRPASRSARPLQLAMVFDQAGISPEPGPRPRHRQVAARRFRECFSRKPSDGGEHVAYLKNGCCLSGM